MRALISRDSSPVRFSATTAVACMALVLSGCALGILLGRWTATPPPIGDRPADSSATPPDIATALGELQRTAEAILEAIRGRKNDPQLASNQRESDAPAPDTLDRLAAAVERLDVLLQSNGGRLGGRSPAVERWKGPGFPSLPALWQRVHEITRANDPNWGEKFDAEMNRTHLAWTREDLFERYGAPASLSAKNRGLELGYQRKEEPDTTESIVFLVAEDVVVYIYFDVN